MRTPPTDIDPACLIQLLNRDFGRGMTSLSFVPKGEDASNFAAATPGGKLFVRAQRDSDGDRLERALGVSAALRELGLHFVVAPFRSRSGRFTVRVSGYSAAVFPFLEGATAWDAGITENDLCRAAALLSELHQTSTIHLPPLEQEDFGNPFEVPILRAVTAAQTLSPAASAIARETASLLLAEEEDLRSTLGEMAGFKQLAETLEMDRVLTHGDPNLANILIDPCGGIHFLDWGSVAIGPVERDLFFFTGEDFDLFLAAYAGAGKMPVLHPELFRYYFYLWAIQEVADYTGRILFPRSGEGRLEEAHSWAELQPYLPLPHSEIEKGMVRVRENLAAWV